MPSTIREQLGGNPIVPPPIPQGWKPDACPDLSFSQVPWSGFKTPWSISIENATVDVSRTASLTSFDTPLDLGVPDTVWQGSVSGMPFHVPGADAKAQLVLDKGRPPVVRYETRRFLFWDFQVPVSVQQPIEAITLPPVLRREGDPNGSYDRHTYLIRPDAGRLVEIIQIEHSSMFGAEWTAGWDGGGPGIAVWDTTRPWDEVGQPVGVCAAGVPQFPHFIRFDEVANGTLDHAAFFALPKYNPGKTGYARGSDGKDPSHSLRAGERIRLSAEATNRICLERGPRSLEATVAIGLRKHGAIVGDTAAVPALVGTQDRRWRDHGWKGLGTKLSDFEVVVSP